MSENKELERDLRALLNRYSAEDASDTPDFILADYLIACLNAYNTAVGRRKDWHGQADEAFGAMDETLKEANLLAVCETVLQYIDSGQIQHKHLEDVVRGAVQKARKNA